MRWVVAYAVATLVYNWCSGLPGLSARVQAPAHAWWCLATALALAIAARPWRWLARWRQPPSWQAVLSGLGGVAAGTGSLLAVTHKDLLAAQVLLRAGSLVLAGLLDPQPSVLRRWTLVLPVTAVVAAGLTGRPEFAAEAVPALALYLGGYSVKYYVARRQRVPALAVLADDLFAHETLVSAVAFVLAAAALGAPPSPEDVERLHLGAPHPLAALALWPVAVGAVGAQVAVVAWTRLLTVGTWRLGDLVPVMRSAGLFAALAVTVLRDHKLPSPRDLAGVAVLVLVTYLGRPPAKEAHGLQGQD